MSTPGDGSLHLTSAGRPGVIHDIGYRHYEGPRLGRGYIAGSLFIQSLRGCYGLGRSAKSKVMPILLFAIMCIPALIIVIVAIATKSDSIPMPSTRYAMALLPVVAVFVAAQSPQCVSRDLRFRVISLYFSRPLLRRDYVLAKYLAMTSALLILLAAPLTVIYAGALLADMPVWRETRHYLLGLSGAVCFALVLAGVGLAVAAMTPRRGLGVAAVITVLLITYSAASAVQGIAFDAGETTLAGYAGLFSPFTLVDGVQVWMLGAEPSTPAGPPGTVGGLVFLGVAAAVIAATYATLLWRYRKVSVS